MSEEPRGMGEPEEPLQAASAVPGPMEGAAGMEPRAEGEPRKEEPELPEGAEEAVSREAARPEGAEAAGQEAPPPEGAEGTSQEAPQSSA